MQFVLIMTALAMFGWGAYQWARGEAYVHTGMTRFSPVKWVTREEACGKFWGAIFCQFLCGCFLVFVAFTKY